MFGSAVLDVALGLTFLYLAMSLICSGINEFLAALTARRAEILKRSLFYMFNKDNPLGLHFLSKFLTHPLINGLSPRNWTSNDPPAVPEVTDPGSAAAAAEALRKTVKGPHYIPDTTFSHVVFDILARGESLLDRALPFEAEAETWGAVGPLLGRLREAAGALPEGPAREAVLALAGEPATRVMHDLILTSGSQREVWERLNAGLRKVRAGVETLAEAAPGRGAVLAVLDAEEPRVKIARVHAASLDQVRPAVASALAAIAGAIGALPEGAEKAALATALDRARQAVALDARVLIAAPAYLQKVREAYDAFRGAIAASAGDGLRTKLVALLEDEGRRVLSLEGEVVTIEKLRAAVTALPDSQIKTALRALFEEGATLAQARASLETWFNDSMDRVSGWYKRHTQVVIILISVVATVLLNADTVVFTNALMRDPALRAAVVQAARDEVDRGQGFTSALRTKAVATAPGPSDEIDPGTVARKIDRIEAQLEGLHVPIYWSRHDYDQAFGKDARPDYVPRKLFGLMVTAIAVSMGAPFWFDVLNKLVNLRATGEKPGKSADRA